MKSIYQSLVIALLISNSCFSQTPFKVDTKLISLTCTKVKASMGNGEYIVVACSKGGFSIEGPVLGPKRITSFNLSEAPNAGPGDANTAIGFVLANMNGLGYGLKSTLGNLSVDGTGVVQLYFEKSDSYKEQELYKIVNELTTRIDTVARRYTDSAMRAMQVNVLNYLKAIPDEVITQSYKETLSKQILSEAEDKVRKMLEEMKKEIRSLSSK